MTDSPYGAESRALSRRTFLGRTAALGLGSCACTPLARALDMATKGKLNVLFIPVDDLRPDLGCYGSPDVLSPNIDRLARTGFTFRRAYCQQAICGPSRASLLSGCRPDTTGIYKIGGRVSDRLPDITTLPGLFKENGYRTLSFGKVYHPGSDDMRSWDECESMAGRRYAGDAEYQAMLTRLRGAKARGETRLGKYYCGAAWEAVDKPDTAYVDGRIAARAIAAMEKCRAEPFFLAAGFHKPHLPFVAPEKYWDLYDPDRIEIPPATRPENAPGLAFTNWSELRSYTNIPAVGDVDADTARTLIHAYRACVSFVDTQVGKLLDALDRLRLADRTVVVLFGDHGWKLGEYGDWSKHTNFELDAHAPLIFRAPGMPGGVGTDALVEFVDIYPTLAELCSLPVPPHCEGTSAVPLFGNPTRPWKLAAFSQYPRFRGKGENKRTIMGYTIRSGDWRYVEWRDTATGNTIARELYDHGRSDVASRDLAEQPEHRETVIRLSKIMAAGWKNARPK